MFDTKIAIMVREDLQVWQQLNVTAFMLSGVVVGVALLDGKLPEVASVGVEPVGAPLKLKLTLAGSPLVVDPLTRLTVTV